MKIEIQIDAATILRVFFALLLLWAGLSKLPDPHGFYASISAYGIEFPKAYLKWAALVVPWFEILLGLALLISLRPVNTTVLLAVLLATFVILTGQAWVRGLELRCGCLNLDLLGMDPGSPSTMWLKSAMGAFFRSVILLGMALWLWYSISRSRDYRRV